MNQTCSTDQISIYALILPTDVHISKKNAHCTSLEQKKIADATNAKSQKRTKKNGKAKKETRVQRT